MITAAGSASPFYACRQFEECIEDEVVTSVSRTSGITNQEELTGLVGYHFVHFCEEYHVRKSEPNAHRGAWYASEYYEYLMARGDTKRLAEHLRAGDFYYDIAPHGMRKVPARLHYQIDYGVLPTAVFDDLIEGKSLCFIDCTMAYEIAFYQTIRDLWGDKKFNEYFAYGGEHPLVLSAYLERTPLMEFCKNTEREPIGGEKGERAVKRGARYGIWNHPDYGKKHLNNLGRSYNVICVDATPGSQRYAAFGTPGSGFTEDEFLELCAAEFNKDTEVDFAIIPRGVRIDSSCCTPAMQAKQVTPREVEESGGGFDPTVLGLELDWEKVCRE